MRKPNIPRQTSAWNNQEHQRKPNIQTHSDAWNSARNKQHSQASASELINQHKNQAFANDGSFLRVAQAVASQAAALQAAAAVQNEPEQIDQGNLTVPQGCVKAVFRLDDGHAIDSDRTSVKKSDKLSQSVCDLSMSPIESTSTKSEACSKEEELDSNKLAAKAMRAKMMGNMSEFERLHTLSKSAAQRRQDFTSQEDHIDDSDNNLVEVTVGEEHVGLIIGKGGSTLHSMQEATGAKIRVTKEFDAENGDRIVQLMGPSASIDRAQALIEEKLSSVCVAAHRKRQRAPKADRTTIVPTPIFDPNTGQLKIVEQRVKSSDTDLSGATKRPNHSYEPNSSREGLSVSQIAAAERRDGMNRTRHHRDFHRKITGITPDDEYDSDIRIFPQSNPKRAQQDLLWVSREARNESVIQEQQMKRLNIGKHCVIAVGTKCRLRLEDCSPIGLGHCIIEPLEPVISHVDAEEDVAIEVRNFQKCLVRMFESRGARPIFFEQVLLNKNSSLRSAMSIECVPLPLRDVETAPGYFKKAILESESEWATHKQVYATNGCVRGIVPPNFPYFDVSFGLLSGFAHVIEDGGRWKVNFGRDIIEGFVAHPDSGIPLQGRVRLSVEEMCRRVDEFGRAFSEVDWTKGIY